MKLVVFGLTVSSSWGNGHATLWRGLCKSLDRRGHKVIFFEHDVPYYATQRDLSALPGSGELRFYSDWASVTAAAGRELKDADVAMVTSYCPDGRAASRMVLDSPARLRCFYDLDTPVTLDRLRRGEEVPYLPLQGLGDFDLVLSYTGGSALAELQQRLGARRVAPLYGSVDPETHYPVAAVEEFGGDLSYLGTYAEDRQAALEELLVEPARRLPRHRFIIGGAQYPATFPWTENIFFVRHLAPAAHAAFFCSSRVTLNITRRAMAAYGYCPSGRLFEAAACGVPILSDSWAGLEQFLTPGVEVLTAGTTEEAVAALSRSDRELRQMAQAAQERTMAQHTADRRVAELERILHEAPRTAAVAAATA